MSRSLRVVTFSCLLTVVLVVLMLARPAPVSVAATPAPTASAMTADEVRVFVTRWLKANGEALKTGNCPEFVGEFYSPKFVQHNQGSDPDSGFSDVVATCVTVHGATSDFHTEIKDVMVEGNRFTVLMVNRATNTGPWPPLITIPTNKKLEWQEVDLCRIADGKIQECRQVWDSLNLLLQLGLEISMPKK